MTRQDQVDEPCCSRLPETMETYLQDRGRVGVPDFVLLDDYDDENAFVDNLHKRFKEDIIYTYIGPVVVSVNPYKPLDIYGKEHAKKYRNVAYFEVPPHIYALTDTAYRALVGEQRNQCILISGESGAGKTEASKKILEYIAQTSTTSNSSLLERVKGKLLQSNPLLESFGNAKTHRNDNSSRFGKYMDIQFDYKGEPVGGHILNYLLEKSRVVQQGPEERNFHIFYQLLAGAETKALDQLYLSNDPKKYNYISSGFVSSDAVEDSKSYKLVRNAMNIVEFSQKDQDEVLRIVASILHLGNVEYERSQDYAHILNKDPIDKIAKLLLLNFEDVSKSLVMKTIDAQGDIVVSPLSPDQGAYARDAFAKAVYERLFVWLVRKINNSMKCNDEKTGLIGILDIYGFEIFKVNSFEQLCINYCNEKLQQLFIELTLKSEQEEYRREGIEWEEIKYFNNKVICDLIEEKHRGLIAILDEECMRPGDTSDATFLYQMTEKLNDHPHFLCQIAPNKTRRKNMKDEDFSIRHYAGDVTYTVNGFIDKNNDLLFRDMKELATRSGNSILRECFPVAELINKKRPDTAATQFKNSLNQLMNILMLKDPSYIRCIKPNDRKSPGIFDQQLVKHQLKYLALIENTRVRRAGFAYRRPYDIFLKRYKSLSSQTWPNWNGKPADGVRAIVKELDLDEDEYKMGVSKIFVRTSETLFRVEDSFQTRKNELAVVLQSKWRAYHQRSLFLKMKTASNIITRYVRRFIAQKEAAKRRHAVNVIRKFIKGFITRNGEVTDENRLFIAAVKRQWLLRLSKSLPKSVLNKYWPPCPDSCKEASQLLKDIHMRHRVRIYVLSLTPDRKLTLQRKLLAEDLFKSQKASYASTVPIPFQDNRLNEEETSQLGMKFSVYLKNPEESILYSAAVTKYDRHGYKPRERVFVLTNAAIYLLDSKEWKIKQKAPFEDLKAICVTKENDELVLLRFSETMEKNKGDLILNFPSVIEVVTRIVEVTGKPECLTIENSSSIRHYMKNGKSGVIDINKGNTNIISKGKNGHLVVMVTE